MTRPLQFYLTGGILLLPSIPLLKTLFLAILDNMSIHDTAC